MDLRRNRSGWVGAVDSTTCRVSFPDRAQTHRPRGDTPGCPTAASTTIAESAINFRAGCHPRRRCRAHDSAQSRRDGIIQPGPPAPGAESTPTTPPSPEGTASYSPGRQPRGHRRSRIRSILTDMSPEGAISSSAGRTPRGPTAESLPDHGLHAEQSPLSHHFQHEESGAPDPPGSRDELQKYIAGIIRSEGGVLLNIGGMPDHVHLIVRLKPDRSVAEMVRLVKSNSSRWLNESHGESGRFAWQSGYGAFSVSQPSSAPSKNMSGTRTSTTRSDRSRMSIASSWPARDRIRRTVYLGLSWLEGGFRGDDVAPSGVVTEGGSGWLHARLGADAPSFTMPPLRGWAGDRDPHLGADAPSFTMPPLRGLAHAAPRPRCSQRLPGPPRLEPLHQRRVVAALHAALLVDLVGRASLSWSREIPSPGPGGIALAPSRIVRAGPSRMSLPSTSQG